MELFPTIYIYGDEGVRMVTDYPLDQLVQCHATGGHCILIHRRVLADPKWLDDKHPQPWFRMGFREGGEVSEDQFFCMKAGALGFPVFVDTSIKTGHVKTFVADEDLYLAQRAALQAVMPAPATDEVAVIVPVLGRPQNAEPFMRSLRASTGLANVYAVCSNSDDAVAWKRAGAIAIDTDEISFPAKVNHAHRYRQNTRWDEPWVFLTGDDVRFHAGWLDHAQQTARDTGALVVGTNDLGNPRVMSGEHAVHMLISREYIDEVGASWDGPGVVCHEGYRHNFVDNEIVVAAKQRGVWAPCLASVVEHLHPAWGKGEMDDTYRKGQFRAEKDRVVFEARLKASMSVVAA